MSPTSYLTAPPRVALGPVNVALRRGHVKEPPRPSMLAMSRPIAVVDLGTNSTRLLVAEVHGGRVEELERRSTVTRLGEGVDANGRLAPAAIGRVLETLAGYRKLIDSHG